MKATVLSFVSERNGDKDTEILGVFPDSESAIEYAKQNLKPITGARVILGYYPISFVVDTYDGADHIEWVYLSLKQYEDDLGEDGDYYIDMTITDELI